MEFRTVYDKAYLVFITGMMLLLGAILVILPMVVMQESLVGLIIANTLFVLFVIWLFWSHMSIRIILEDEELVVKSGPFRFSQKYSDIRTIRKTSDFLTGKRVLTSRKGLAISDVTTLSELKISPERQEQFLHELQKLAPQVRFIQ